MIQYITRESKCEEKIVKISRWSACRQKNTKKSKGNPIVTSSGFELLKSLMHGSTATKVRLIRWPHDTHVSGDGWGLVRPATSHIAVQIVFLGDKVTTSNHRKTQKRKIGRYT